MSNILNRLLVAALWGIIVMASFGLWNLVPTLFVALAMPQAFLSDWFVVFVAWNIAGLLGVVASVCVEEGDA